MEKIIIPLFCICVALASEHSHTIPIEGYEAKLQDLGQHVEYSHTPVKVIKITKTVAVKVPVPYPVKVVQKIPYPVHINKPYPVPVPQIVHVPHVVHPGQTKGSDSSQHGGAGSFGQQYAAQGSSYEVHEPASSNGHSQNEHSFTFPSGGQSGHSFLPVQDDHSQSYNINNGGGYDQGHSTGGDDHSSEGFASYDAGNHYGPSGAESEESLTYNKAINEYFQQQKQNNEGNNGYH